MPRNDQVILLAHGSSDIRWCKSIEHLAAPTLATVPNSILAYLELSSPSLEQVVENSAAAGCGHFVVIPLFLAAGRHLRVDVPKQIEALQVRFDVRIKLLPPAGENPVLGEAICHVAQQSLEHNNE